MSRFSKIIPKGPLEQERFYLDTITKLENTDTTLADEEKKSGIPFLGMISEARRMIESITRDNRQLRAHITRLEARISDIERQL